MTGRKSKPKGLRARKPAAQARRARQASKSQDTSARAQAAAPLLAHTSKKVSAPQKSPRKKSSRNSKPQADANYQPKTQPPAAPVKAESGPPATAMDVMAMAQPWMTIGWRMTAAGLSFQASMARAALSMPPATAMRQGAEALNAWFALMQTRPPKRRKD
jgi:hypothetical protein